jgi:hypothetical protein
MYSCQTVVLIVLESVPAFQGEHIGAVFPKELFGSTLHETFLSLRSLT